MLLPGYVLASEGTEVHIAAWPGAPPDLTRSTLLSKAFASQASCYVVVVGACQPEMPDLGPGASMIIAPGGQILEGPVEGEAILIADLDPGAVHQAKVSADNGGHYSRRDIFNLKVDRRPRRGFSDGNEKDGAGVPESDRFEARPGPADSPEPER